DANAGDIAALPRRHLAGSNLKYGLALSTARGRSCSLGNLFL
ncbi:MAG: hypothetical protein AVDCRST_MAG93-1281, partial [uncultured Chloroflexia bacterium]